MIKAYYVIREDLEMSQAKFGVQIGHGTQLLVLNAKDHELGEWIHGADSRKIICKISSEAKLNNLVDYLISWSHHFSAIYDSGYTEFKGRTLTGVCFFIDDEKDPEELIHKIRRLRLWLT